MTPTITASIVPWGEVKPGNVVLSDGQIAVVREVRSTWEQGVGLSLFCPTTATEVGRIVHREEHVDSLTAILSGAAAEPGGEVSPR